MKKLIVAFRNFANALVNLKTSHLGPIGKFTQRLGPACGRGPTLSPKGSVLVIAYYFYYALVTACVVMATRLMNHSALVPSDFHYF